MINKITSIVLAAGKGTRMNSSTPKPLHEIAGKSLIGHVIDGLTSVGVEDVIVVINKDQDDLKKYLSETYPITRTAIQEEQLGTGNAVKVVFDQFDLSDSTGILIVFGDTPLLSQDTLDTLINSINENDLNILTFESNKPEKYGRIILKNNKLESIIEDADANEEEKKINLCNSGVMALRNINLKENLNSINNNNAKNEYILSDLVSIINEKGGSSSYLIGQKNESMGIDTKHGLAKAEKEYQRLIRNKFLSNGVTLKDPASTFFSWDTKIGKDVKIENNVFIGPKVEIGNNVIIRAFSYLDESIIRKDSIIGPFARLRNNVEVGEGSKIGNFVEVKNSKFSDDVKVSHLAYIGDAEIGENSNIGAGTITCNYDGKNKNKTHIGKNSFVGSNSSLVAPISIGDDAHIGAGSVITRNVEDGDLVLTRAPLKIISNWSKKIFRKVGKG